MRVIGPLVFGIVISLIGLVGLFLPLKIQKFALSSPTVTRYNPFLEWMKKPAYILSLRFCGTLALVTSIFIFYMLIFNGSN